MPMVLPARSSIDWMSAVAMIWSLPVELSFTSTITWSEPAPTEAMVSFSVCVLPSSCPPANVLIESR